MFFAAGILWQLLRLYTVSVLIKIRAKNAEQNGTNGEQPQADTKPIVDAEIINWANEKVNEIPKGATYVTIHIIYNLISQLVYWYGYCLSLIDSLCRVMDLIVSGWDSVILSENSAFLHLYVTYKKWTLSYVGRLFSAGLYWT